MERGLVMDTYFLLGRYASEAVRNVSVDRTEKTLHLIKQLGGEVKSMYAVMGAYDVVLKVALPDNNSAMKASYALNVLTGISFTTLPAVPMDDFDRIVAQK